uniref:Uncharacterized protein n=1 Tax=Romanomermis culicivorax TaxID=13658 RepID=A0A915K1G4_ROMCU
MILIAIFLPVTQCTPNLTKPKMRNDSNISKKKYIKFLSYYLNSTCQTQKQKQIKPEKFQSDMRTVLEAGIGTSGSCYKSVV